MEQYTIYCTEEQTKKAWELGAPIEYAKVIDTIKGKTIRIPQDTGDFYIWPTADQMIGFILGSGKGYSVDLAALIKEYGYKQGCLTFIDNYLK